MAPNPLGFLAYFGHSDEVLRRIEVIEDGSVRIELIAGGDG
jgi:hypothetical protein